MDLNDNEDGEDQLKSAAITISKFGQNSTLVKQFLCSMDLSL